MRDNQDVHRFIQAFAGDNRYIVDYLIEEVLQRQPEAVRSFLLRTSILDRLNGSLCDAVMRHQDSSARLEALQRGNFFLIPLDDKRHWYRYHHLFADVLHMHLMAEQPDQVPVLHRRASEWYERHSSPAMPRAGWRGFRASGGPGRAGIASYGWTDGSTALGWFQALSVELFHHRPILSILYAGVLLQAASWKCEARCWMNAVGANADK
jgi:LuxR family maltose regulon positive regulatory protein